MYICHTRLQRSLTESLDSVEYESDSFVIYRTEQNKNFIKDKRSSQAKRRWHLGRSRLYTKYNKLASACYSLVCCLTNRDLAATHSLCSACVMHIDSYLINFVGLLLYPGSNDTTCLSFIDGILGFVVPNLSSVIRLMTETHLILCLSRNILLQIWGVGDPCSFCVKRFIPTLRKFFWLNNNKLIKNIFSVLKS